MLLLLGFVPKMGSDEVPQNFAGMGRWVALAYSQKEWQLMGNGIEKRHLNATISAAIG